jgi:hypothetical protein
MSGFRQRFLGLCLPPMIFCVLEFTLTWPRTVGG